LRGQHELIRRIAHLARAGTFTVSEC
jgi:hypothetical protein